MNTSIFFRVPINIYLIFVTLCLKLVQTEMDGNIVGGSYADITNFPHSAFIVIYDRTGTQLCGSSVLNQRLLLTAAHCLESNEKRHIEAMAGNHNLDKMTIIRVVQSFKIHEWYDTVTIEADIALLWLKSPLPLSNRVSRVYIPDGFTEGVSGYLAGWGDVSDTGDSEPYLKTTAQTILNHDFCRQRYRYYRPGMMCAKAGNQQIYGYAGRGDSGSALVTQKNLAQIGIVSFKLGSLNDVIYYTNVSYYYRWIVTNSHSLACSYYKSKRSRN